MIGLIIASHGNMCTGLKETAELFAGEIPQCVALPFMPGMTGEAYDEILEKAIGELDTGQGVLIMTDLRGGSPYNRCAGMVFRGKNIRVLAGMNLDMVLSFALSADRESPIDEVAQAALEDAKAGMEMMSGKPS